VLKISGIHPKIPLIHAKMYGLGLPLPWNDECTGGLVPALKPPLLHEHICYNCDNCDNRDNRDKQPAAFSRDPHGSCTPPNMKKLIFRGGVSVFDPLRRINMCRERAISAFVTKNARNTYLFSQCTFVSNSTNPFKGGRQMHLGYACINVSLGRKIHSLRLATLRTRGIAYLQKIVNENVSLLADTLRWNRSHQIMMLCWNAKPRNLRS
jgi:hypothetical protein